MASRPLHVLARATLILSLVTVAACDETTPAPTAPEGVDVEGLEPSFEGQNPNRSTSEVFAYPDGTKPLGWSKLIRRKNRVRYRVKTTGLEKGHAYTLWMVIFNNPEGCDTQPCSDFDLFNAKAKPDLMFAGGKVVRRSGKTVFRGTRRIHSLRGSVNGPVGLPSNGLTNPYGADIRFVIHHHGPRDRKYMPDMVRSIDGGCKDAGVPFEGFESPWNLYDGPRSLPGYGRRGDNTCQSVQFAVHLP